ncbi:MAG: DUF2207 domain-containing protein [Gemmatimonadota bacterium]
MTLDRLTAPQAGSHAPRISRVSTGLTASLLLVLAPAGAAAQRSMSIQRFDATLRVEASGWTDVREEIQVRFTGSWNGIYRTIPVEYRTPQGFSYRLFLKDVTVTGPGGEAYGFSSSRERHYRKLKIRVPGAQDATRTVFIHYRVRNALKFWDEYDELYWNVTGDEWEVPIQEASAMVILPRGVEGTRTASWTGGYGAAENAASVEPTDDGYFFQTRRSLNYREGLTIAVAWNPGVVARPTALDRTLLFLRANWILLLPLLSLGLMWRVWYLRGRDPARLSVSPQYEPPEELTPAEAGTLIDNRPDMRDITAALVDLAVRGYLRIEEVKADGMLGRLIGKEDYSLVPVKPRERWSELRDHEREMLEGIFGGGDSGTPLPETMSGLAHSFYRHLGDIRSGIFRELVGRGYYQRRPDKVLGTWMAVGFVVAGVGITAGLPLARRFELSPLTLILAVVLSALPVFVFGFFMPARTVKGARVRERILGFEEFLDRVESERYKRMITSPEMFERFLPYAMAFGVERKWAAAFDDIYTEPPTWYVGTWHGGFRPTLFVHSMGQMSATATTALGSGPRSSGGSGFGGGGGFSGGGFSGGGFGGGGGGGW